MNGIKRTGKTGTAGYFVLIMLVLTLLSACADTGATGGDTGGLAASAAPYIMPEPGVHYLVSGSSLTVSIESPSRDAEIFFTLDGTEPAENSTRYVSPFLVDSSIVVRAVALEDGKRESPAAHATFVILETSQTSAPPLISPAGGLRHNPTSISISSATVDAKIYYTTDGSLPHGGSTLYEGPFTIDAPVQNVRAVAIKAGEERSLSSASFSFSASMPEILRRGQWEGYWDRSGSGSIPDGGIFAAAYYEAPARGTSLTVGSATGGAEIRFTVDGSIPEESSLLYTGRMMVWWDGNPGNLRIGGNFVTGPITSSTGMKIRVFREGYEPSPVFTMGFTTAAPTPAPY
ncbi:chitobiase/beta-hexosaminidase C-terminal domain-containing protein [Marispirochaeta aestuarii]|uniref:chitobiase/beta-hexosaminidase C-terminal domain-containing protein n=1 Tax=Marispirochaeta aestuarii TaxID=1963862 RepID=UPI0029C6DD1E|nr:chitobiase/beta-hexosaminidase C-terminal domain-containing protein [Marispirochaeta aestuarii]